jgi:competence protein ComEC
MSVFHHRLRRNSALLSLIFLLLVAVVACISSVPASTFASTSPQLSAGSDTQTLSITLLDVGDGDAILIMTSQGHAALIDGGPRKTQVRDTLKERGIKRLDLVVNTHPHADHLTGLPAVLDEFPVGQMIDSGTVHYSKTYESYLATIGQRGIPLVTPRDIARFRLGPVRLDVLRPSVYFASERSGASPVNDSTPVIEISYGAFSALLTGDATAATELQLIARGWLSPVTLLKVAHHGSDTSTSQPFPDVVKPQIAVISVGKGSNGLPSDAVLGRLEECGATVYRTNLHGNVTVSTNGHAWTVTTERQPDAGPDA